MKRPRELEPKRIEWTGKELARFVATLYLLFVAVTLLSGSPLARVLQTGDNSLYAAHAATIRGASPPQSGATHFLGYPLLVATVASLLRITEVEALPLVSLAGSIGAVALAWRLWGAWVAALFAVVNLDWIQRSILGGADPVFACVVFAGLFLARRGQWVSATALASIATVVRPLGILALAAIGLRLAWTRQFRTLALSVATGLAFGGLYFGLVHALYGEGLANVLWYRGMGLGRDRTFIPFVTLFLPTAGHELTWKNIVKAFVWTAITIAAILAVIFRKDLRETTREAPVEWLFGGLYTASFLFFPAWWIEGEYSRYLSPVIPLCLVALRPWLPERKTMVWAIGTFCVLLAAVEDSPEFQRLVATFAQR